MIRLKRTCLRTLCDILLLASLDYSGGNCGIFQYQYRMLTPGIQSMWYILPRPKSSYALMPCHAVGCQCQQAF